MAGWAGFITPVKGNYFVALMKRNQNLLQLYGGFLLTHISLYLLVTMFKVGFDVT